MGFSYLRIELLSDNSPCPSCVQSPAPMTRPFSKRTDRQLKKVLLVEGGSSARDRHSATLARNGYEVETSDSIQTAHRLFTPRKYALVVVSLNGFGEAAAAFCNDIKEADAG